MIRQLIMLPFLSLIIIVLLLPLSILAQTYEAENMEKEEIANLRIQVTEKGTSDPVKGAEVFVRAEMEDREFERSVKTNSQGIARLTDVPRGKVLIQVTAKGWEPFGDKYDLSRTMSAAQDDEEPTQDEEIDQAEEKVILIDMEKESQSEGDET